MPVCRIFLLAILELMAGPPSERLLCMLVHGEGCAAWKFAMRVIQTDLLVDWGSLFILYIHGYGFGRVMDSNDFRTVE
jgi:hypothetical protein